jgi:FkbM family methyltransferase
MIPKIVHITCKDFSLLPAEILKKNQQLEQLNPDYQFRYYDDRSMLEWIVENCNRSTCEVFLKINPNYGAARADLFRYLILNHIGGVYLDIKSSCTVPFNKFIHPTDRFITSHWMRDDGMIDPTLGIHLDLLKNKLVEFQQWFVIAQPDNPVLTEIIDRVVANLQKKPNAINTKFGRVGVLESTGPIVFTKAVSDFEEGIDFTLINSKKCGLVYSIYEKEGIETHYKLFDTHYSQMFEPIINKTSLSFFFATLFNKFIKQYYLRMQLKMFKSNYPILVRRIDKTYRMNSFRRFLHFMPLVRLHPRKTFLIRLKAKIGRLLRWAFNVVLLRMRLKGARIVGSSPKGNVFLKFNVDTLIADKGSKILIPRDLFIFESIRNRGVWEFEVCTFLAEAFSDVIETKNNATILLDIGANSGMNSLLTARLARVPIITYCVEPLPINIEALEENLSNESKLGGFKIFPYALGKNSERASIFSEKSNLGNTSLLEMNKKDFITTEIEIKETVQFIENEIPNYANLVLKCDTQGFEVTILSDFPIKFWNRIVRGVIEIRASYDLEVEDLNDILRNLDCFTKLYWGNDTETEIKISEVQDFWLSGTEDERDLYFSK